MAKPMMWSAASVIRTTRGDEITFIWSAVSTPRCARAAALDVFVSVMSWKRQHVRRRQRMVMQSSTLHPCLELSAPAGFDSVMASRSARQRHASSSKGLHQPRRLEWLLAQRLGDSFHIPRERRLNNSRALLRTPRRPRRIMSVSRCTRSDRQIAVPGPDFRDVVEQISHSPSGFAW